MFDYNAQRHDMKKGNAEAFPTHRITFNGTVLNH